MKIALVTGGAKGLGFAWSHQLARQGYKVILCSRDLHQAEQAAHQINEEELVVYPKQLDPNSEIELQSLVTWAEGMFGRIDLVINNAAVNPKDYADKSRMAKTFSLDQLNADEVLEVIKTNTLAPLIVVKHLRPLLRKSEHPIVVNISSWMGSIELLNFGGHYGYVGSKHLLNFYNKSMAFELKSDSIITVNVNPGWVQTDMGGSKAKFTPDESVLNMIEHVVKRVNLEDSGKFFQYDGTVHPW